MNALILNGGGTREPYGGIEGRLSAWLGFRGICASAFDLTQMDIKPCRGCFECWTATPGLCLQHDAMESILPVLATSDLIAWITPVVYGGYGFHLKKALDRSIPILLPFFVKIRGEVHHPMRYGLEPRLAAIGVLPTGDPDTERIFHGLVTRNAVNMHATPVSLVLHEGEADGAWEEHLTPLLSGMEP